MIIGKTISGFQKPRRGEILPLRGLKRVSTCVIFDYHISSVQVAGYKNSVVPENLYRTAILTGWTGNEVIYANYMDTLWNNIEGKSQR
jgi:hypothetical protein